MSRCRWDRASKQYLSHGEPCRVDDYGDPTRHCRARRSCANHVGALELTCARCLARTRADLRRIVDLSPLMFVQALNTGVNSDAAYLAGPAADVRDWTERRAAMRGHLAVWMERGYVDRDGNRTHLTEKQWLRARATMEIDDEHHPETVLTRWQMVLSGYYGHTLPPRLTVLTGYDYLDGNLSDLAQEAGVDFPRLRDELRTCREHLEAVIVNSAAPERGAPCPDCLTEKRIERMVRHYGHWCDDPECERIHYGDDAGDRWVCPRDRTHWRTHEDYNRWIEERVLS